MPSPGGAGAGKTAVGLRSRPGRRGQQARSPTLRDGDLAAVAQDTLRVAGIDIGSNGIRLLVADATGPDSFTVVHRDRAAVRLGHQTFTQGHLDPDAVGKAIEALAGFRNQIHELGVHRVRAVATSAVREAEDTKDFVRAARKKAGLRVEVIDGREEARIVHRAVRERIPWNGKPWLLMDLGGGSLEIALVDQNTIHWSESRRIGTVRLLEKYATPDGAPITDGIHAEVDAFQLLHSPQGLDIGGLAATGGNINDMGRLVAGAPKGDEIVSISLDTLVELRQRLESMTMEERIQDHDMRPDRADVVVPAAMVYERVARLVRAPTIHIPGWGIREGLVLGLIQDHFAPRQEQGPLDRSVEDGALDLGRTFCFDEDHAQHTAHLSLQLFDDLAELHGLGEGERRILHAAAILHDIGRAIADKGHHKHSQYLIEHAELPGLNEKEIQMAATVARYHRKAHPQEHHHLYRLFGTRTRRKVDRLAALLRLADGLDRAHLQNVHGLDATRGPDGIEIRIHGRGRLNLARWAGLQKSDLFQKAFATPVTITEDT